MNRPARREWIAGLSCAALSLRASLASAQTTASCRVIGAAPTVRIDQAFQFLGAKAGFFKQLGVTLDYTTVNGAELSCQLVAAGQGDLAYISPLLFLNLKQTQPKLPLRFVYLHDVSNGFDVAVPPESPYKSIADLKGKTIGVPSLASGAVISSKAMLRHAGVDPSTVSIVAVGTEAQALGALRSKQVDALSLFRGQFAAIENLGIAFRYFPQVALPNSGFVVSDKALKTNRDGVIRGLQCSVLNTIYMELNPEAAVRDFLDLYKPSGDPAAAFRDALHLLKRTSTLWQQIGSHRPWGAIDDGDWRRLVAYLGTDIGLNSAQIDTAALYTNTLIPEVNKVNTALAYQAAKQGR